MREVEQELTGHYEAIKVGAASSSRGGQFDHRSLRLCCVRTVKRPCPDDIAELKHELGTKVGMGKPVSHPDDGSWKPTIDFLRLMAAPPTVGELLRAKAVTSEQVDVLVEAVLEGQLREQLC